MKRVITLLLLPIFFVALISYSCSQEPTDDPDDPSGQTDPSGKEENTDEDGLKPGTFKFVASPLKGTWNAGDCIYVHGALGSVAKSITLTASDISSDGKTATAYLDDVTQYPVDPDGLYAAYPDEAVKHSNGVIGVKTIFSSCETLLTMAYLNGDTFMFVDASSMIAFSISGDYDGYAIATGDRNGLNITRLEVEYTSSKTSFSQKQNDGYPFKYGKLEPGKKVQIWLPGDILLKDGFTIFLEKSGDWKSAYSKAGDIQLKAGDCMDLGDISSSVSAYTGPAPKMPIVEKSSQRAVKFNELSGIYLSEDQTFLWGVGDDGDLARIDFEGNVISSFHIGGDAEDVTIDPATHNLLIGWEDCSNGQGVAVVAAPDFNQRASALFTVKAAAGYGNSGVEGLTYYKDGMVFVGTQHNSHLFLCDLASKTVLWNKMLYDKDRVSEIGGLCYDPLTGWLWIIDSEAKKIFVFAVDHSVNDNSEWDVAMDYLGAYPVSAPSNPESVYVDHVHGCVWVGDDYGSTSYLYKYEMTGLDDAIKGK